MSVVKKNLITRKEFTYDHGTCRLNFTLQIDNNNDLNSFKKCLKEALSDIEDQIKKSSE